jgi:hypothetical protein
LLKVKRFSIAALCLVFLIAPSNPASAQLQEESLVVIDTALNSDQADIAANIKYEVCILDWSACPNGQSFMEGKGSAYLSPRFMSSNGFNHGSQMVSAALKTNPNLQIIFIRIVGSSSSGSRLNVSPYVVAKALKWVSENKDRFNIAAVAMSQGHHNLSVLTRYCPTESPVESMIELLLQKGVPVFVPAGNSRDYERLDWPACIPSTISIGALDSNRQIASYGNIDPKLLDFFEIGDLKITDFDGQLRNATGTSVSVQVAAAKWMKILELNPELTYDQRMQKLVTMSNKVGNSRISDALAFPAVIEDPEVRIATLNELDELRSQLSELQSLIYLLLSALLK